MLPLGNVYTCHGFFLKCVSLKTPIQEHFFTSLLQDLSMKDLVSLNNFLSTKFMKPFFEKCTQQHVDDTKTTSAAIIL